MNLAQYVARGSDLFPNRIALRFEGQSFTYAQLNNESNRIAGALAQLQVGRGDRVALWLPNSTAFIIAYLGIHKVGAVAVTINTALKAEEVAFILEDSGARLLFATAPLYSELAADQLAAVQQVFLTEGEAADTASFTELLKHSSPEYQSVELASVDPAVLLYTSGTTGFPKGALLSHGALIAAAELAVSTLDMQAADRILLPLSLFHSFAQTAAFVPCLAAGATLILHRQFDVAAVLQSIREELATFFFGVPTLYILLQAHAQREQLRSVRRFISAGAALPVAVAQGWYDTIGTVINEGYGLTEICLGTFNQDPLAKPGSAGRPLDGVRTGVVNEAGEQVLPGELGEIVVQSPSLMDGYWQRPTETAAVLRDRWFHTGDIGRLDEDGYLYIIDRVKDMVNVGGVKVYPSEVEHVLYQHPAVTEVAVFGVPEPLLGEQVQAAVVLKADQTVTGQELIAFCRQRLAEFKAPSVVAFVEQLPKSRTGKILKRLLRDEQLSTQTEPPYNGHYSNGSHSNGSHNNGHFAAQRLAPAATQLANETQAAATAMAQWISNWLAEQLEIDAPQIAGDRPFADYGMTSVLAVRLAQALGEWLGRPVPAILLWNFPTLATLVHHLSTDGHPAPTQTSLHPSRALPNGSANSAQPVTQSAIALIGIGCRFPGGANTPEAFWRLLRNGVDTAQPIPADRWAVDEYYDPTPNTPGKHYVRAGHFLDEIPYFDASFFSITPLEAAAMDPQQRLLLEVCWEALEHANLVADHLRESQTGIYIGGFWDDYSARHLYNAAPEQIDSYRILSNLRGMMAGRLAYLLGLHGPVMQLDTACSSSLLAVHLAAQALRSGECDLALAGGVNLVLAPEQLIGLCHMGALSPDGRCKTFAAEADGFGIGEGAGIVVLKRLADAKRDGDPILAIIRGSAVNHDGASNGLTAPNGRAQEALLRQALENAAVQPAQIGYIETHGTGTVLGDPIEVQAISNVLGQARTNPLLLGSVKTNIGHLSGAAGIASLIKVVLALGAGEIPANLHLTTPNPHIPWETAPLQVPTQRVAWQANVAGGAANGTSPLATPRLAGVSSFGLTGTNVHLIVEEASSWLHELNDAHPAVGGIGNYARQPQLNGPVPSEHSPIAAHHGHHGTGPVSGVDIGDRPDHLLTLSAKSEPALVAQIAQFDQWLATPSFRDGGEAALANLCYTAATSRAHFDHRLTIVAADVASARAKLQQAKTMVRNTGRSRPKSGNRQPRIAFLFPGQGPQQVDMGRQLYTTQPRFRRTLDRCAEILRSHLDQPLLEILYSDNQPHADTLLNQATYAQPALFAVEYALATLWRSWGVEPRVVMGHSLGEYAAACLAGVFSLEDGLQLVAARGRLMQEEAPQGRMVAVLGNAADVQTVLAPYRAAVALAAINTPQSVVIAGAPDAVATAEIALHQANLETRPLKIYVASHSPLMEPILEQFMAVARRVSYQRPQLPVVSNLTGAVADEALATPEYWCRHLREPVQFAQGMATLATLGVDTFIEAGPKSTLIGLGQQCWTAGGSNSDPLWLSSIHSKSHHSEHEEWPQLLESLGALFERGATINWQAFDGDYPRTKVTLPRYPFQRQRYWIDMQPKPAARAQTAPAAARHPLLGSQVASALAARNRELLFENHLDPATLPYLADHTLFDQPLVPGAAYLEMALAAGAHCRPDALLCLRDCTIQQGLFLPLSDDSNNGITVQLLLSPADSGYKWQIYSQTNRAQPDNWTLHASGQLDVAQADGQPTTLDLAAVQARCRNRIEPATYEQALRTQGIGYGPAFQALTELAVGVDEAVGVVTLPPTLVPTAGAYQLHPVLLDAALRVASALLPADSADPYLPFGMDAIQLYKQPMPTQLWSYVQRVEQSTTTPEMQQFTVTLLNEQGQTVARIANLTLRRANRQALLGHQRRLDWLYELSWRPVSRAAMSPFAAVPGRWLILADRQGWGAALATRLEAAGAECLLLTSTANDTIEAMQRWLESSETSVPVRGVISLRALDTVLDTVNDDTDVPGAALQLSMQALQLIQTILQSGQTPRLWFVTQGAVGVDVPVVNVAQAPLWGLTRTLQVEQPELACTAIDLSTTVTPDALFAEIWFADAEKQVLLRGNERFAARLTRWEGRPDTQTAPPPQLDPSGSYLVTGGLGGLGLVVAQWLVAQGARHLILAGRRGVTTPAAAAAIEAMESAGARVVVMQADLADPDATQRLLTSCQTVAPLRGIIHAAGVIDDGLLLQQSAERLATVMASKVAGSWHLHTLTRNLPLDFFVCFSSIAALLGNGGQGNYAAANAFIDALAHHRRQEGLPALSINWGGWAEVGLAAELVKTTAAAGLGAIAPAQGVDLLGLLMTHDAPQVGVLPIAWSTFQQTPAAKARIPLLTELVAPPPAQADRPALRQQLAAAPVGHRATRLKAHVQELVTTLLGATPADDESFFHYGLDSLLSIQLANRLAAALSIAVPATVAFKHGTVTELTRYLVEQIGAALGETAETAADATPVETASPTPPISRLDEWYPQLYNQQELFIWHESVVNPASLHIQQSVYIHSAVDVPALEAALQALMARHEALRTVYARRDGQLLQQTPTTQAADFAVVNVQNQPWPAINERVLAAARHPFDLAHGPLLRVRLFTRSADNHLLLLVVHHIAADATALSVIVNELWPLYGALHGDQTAALPPVETTWRAFVHRQLDLLQSSEGERLWRYWQSQIAGAPTALALATDIPRPAQDSHHGRPCYFELDALLTHRLRQLAQQEGCTLYAVLMAGFQLLLHAYTQQRDLLIAAHVANRNDAAYAAVVGYLADTFPIRAQIPDGATVTDVIQQVQGTLLAAMEHQGLPMRLLAERLNVLPTDPTHTALCQVWFTLLPLRLFQESGALFQPGTGTLQLGGLTLEGADLIPAWLGAWYDLELILTEGEEVVFGTLVYKTDLFTEQTVRRMIGDLQCCLQGMITQPTQSVTDLVALLKA